MEGSEKASGKRVKIRFCLCFYFLAVVFLFSFFPSETIEGIVEGVSMAQEPDEQICELFLWRPRRILCTLDFKILNEGVQFCTSLFSLSPMTLLPCGYLYEGIWAGSSFKNHFY